jgi:hypothetical protein
VFALKMERLETTGLILIVASLFGAFLPFAMFSRGTSPEVQAYQDAKGSWIPFGFANTMSGEILLTAAVVGVGGLLLVILSRALEKRRARRVIKQRNQ